MINIAMPSHKRVWDTLVTKKPFVSPERMEVHICIISARRDNIFFASQPFVASANNFTASTMSNQIRSGGCASVVRNLVFSALRISPTLLSASTKDRNISVHCRWESANSKMSASDRVDWQILWQAFRAQGVSEQIVWILQCMYFDQCGEVVTCSERSKRFDIRAGVRQGCVLSPRLFCAAFEWGMRAWRLNGQPSGLVLQEGRDPLTDLRFADFDHPCSGSRWACLMLCFCRQ